jgi:hypothetical protein
MSDWTTDAADAIDRTVALIRERTVEPAQVATRAIVYGLLAALIGIPAVVMTIIMLFRILVELEQNYVWAAWFTLGGIFVLGGAFCWVKRNP